MDRAWVRTYASLGMHAMAFVTAVVLTQAMCCHREKAASASHHHHELRQR